MITDAAEGFKQWREGAKLIRFPKVVLKIGSLFSILHFISSKEAKIHPPFHLFFFPGTPYIVFCPKQRSKFCFPFLSMLISPERQQYMIKKQGVPSSKNHLVYLNKIKKRSLLASKSLLTIFNAIEQQDVSRPARTIHCWSNLDPSLVHCWMGSSS